METELIKINSIDDEALKRAGQCIKDGGLVAFPTETVYGLGGDGLNDDFIFAKVKSNIAGIFSF